MLLTAANAMKVYFVCTFSIMPKISLPFVVSARVAADPRVSIFHFLFCYETMSSCSQNCWFDWNSAVLFHMWLLLATILCTRVFEIWSPRMRITKKKRKKRKKKCITTPLLMPTDDQKPEISFLARAVGSMLIYLHVYEVFDCGCFNGL